LAGQNTQGSGAIAIGNSAGQITQGINGIAIGFQAGQITQGSGAIAIGFSAGQTRQKSAAIAIGISAGAFDQSGNTIAIGFQAGQTRQYTGSIAIGYQAGTSDQGSCAIAIGFQAGKASQGVNSIAIGTVAGEIGQGDNSIIISALETGVTGGTNGTYIAPIRSTSTSSNIYGTMLYLPGSNEVLYSSSLTAGTKTFIIDHPINKDKYLVHCCLEGPEGGVYYRGHGEIINNEYTIIKLPKYVKELATNFTVQLTPIYCEKEIKQLYTSEVENNSFKVYGENCKFYWLVQGKRCDIEVEPYKLNVSIKGSGPYKWI
jgi:hypothetical protein